MTHTGEWPYESESTRSFIDMGDGVTAPPSTLRKNPDLVFVDGHVIPKASIRKFDTGATRDQDTTKFDYEGFLSPLAINRFAIYMHENRVQADGSIRDSDNWQKGIPLSSYMKSLWRHLMTVWCHHRKQPGDLPRTGGTSGSESLEDALCGVIFNAQGYLHEIMKAKGE